MSVVVGLDIGGTSTKATAVDAAGTVIGRGRSGGGNPRSSAGDLSQHFIDAVRMALGATPSSEVAAVVAGIAGAASSGQELLERLSGDLAVLGITADLEIGTDLDIAFFAAAPHDSGTLLLSGTGAVAARYLDGIQIARCDGLGWRLGDEGSGWWIGSRAVRAVAAALDGRGPATSLVDPVRHRLGVREELTDSRQNLVRAVADLDAAGLARLVPDVLSAADSGDPVATTILDEAVAALLHTHQVLTGSDTDLDVVLAGGVLSAPNRVRTAVAEALGGRGHRVHPSEEPVRGALLRAASLAGWETDPIRRSTAATGS